MSEKLKQEKRDGHYDISRLDKLEFFFFLKKRTRILNEIGWL